MVARTAVLIVDDDPIVVASLLRAAPPNLSCVVASGCAAAVALIASRPDLRGLITEVRLGDGSGLDVVVQWRGTFDDAPAVVISGFYDDPIPARFAFRRGCHFLPKPFEADDFELFEAEVEAKRWGLSRALATRFMGFVLQRGFSAKQAVLFACLLRRESWKPIAETLGVTVNSLRTARRRLLDRLGVTTVKAAHDLVMRSQAGLRGTRSRASPAD